MSRVGLGYDAHRFAVGRTLVLCGVEVPCDEGLAGHSDADVAVHALMDAILGAAGLGDIGELFPDTDSRFEGASSIGLLARRGDAGGDRRLAGRERRRRPGARAAEAGAVSRPR